MTTQSTRVDGRSKAARAAKREIVAARRLDQSECAAWRNRSPMSPFEKPEVLAAALAVEQAQEVRNSVRRKLFGGSTAVEPSDLSAWEARLGLARTALADIAPDHPLIVTSALLG